jgi:hypothetical protein
MLRRAMGASRAVCFVLCGATAGCGRGHADAHGAADASPSTSANASVSALATGAANAAEASRGPAFAGTFDGNRRRFGHGLARALPSGEIAIALTTEPLACDAAANALDTPGAPNGGLDAITLRVSPGPNAKYFAGAAIGVEARVALASARRWDTLPPRLVRLTLSPLAGKPGEHVRGTLALDALTRDDATGATRSYRAQGPFDVALCPGEFFDRLVGERADAPATALAGHLDKSVLKARSAIAIARHDALNGMDYLAEIIFYDRGEMSCDWHTDMRRQLEYLTIDQLSGVSSRAPAPGVPQPARPFFWTASKTDVYSKERHTFGDAPLAARAWFQLDTVSFDDGAPISGVVVAGSPAAARADQNGRFEGAFTGIVCRR